MVMVKAKTLAKILREFDEFNIKMLHLNRVAYIEKKGRVIEKNFSRIAMITMMKMMKMKTNKKGGGGDKYENDE
jgi:hypothetical protein